MVYNITTSLRRNEIDKLEQKANAKGITKCAYVRELIISDLGNQTNSTNTFVLEGLNQRV